MTIRITPTKIKNSTYLLIPKSIVDMVDVDDTTKFSLKIRQNGKSQSWSFGLSKSEITI